MAERLTSEAAIKRIILPAGKRQTVIFDTEIRGFGVRVVESGTKSYVLDYRIAGRQRRLTIGRVGEWSLSAARDRAAELRREIDKGRDPLDPIFAIERAYTFTDAWLRYEKDYLPKLAERVQKNVKSRIDRHVLPVIGTRSVKDVGFGDIETIHHGIEAKYEANRTVETITRIFNLAIKWGWVERNPAKGIEKHDEQPRQDYLEPEEIRRLLGVLYDENTVQADIAKMLLLTGARFGEVARMKWDQINLNTGIWTKPAAATKQRRMHRVPLSAAVVDIIKTQAAKGSEWVFPNPDTGEPFTHIRKTWTAACKSARVRQVRIHDTRHSFASLLASGGISLQVVGNMLGHTVAQTTQRYAHLYDDALKSAAETVADHVAPPGKKRSGKM